MKAIDQIKNYFAENSTTFLTAADVAKGTGLAPKTVGNNMSKLVRDGFVVREKREGNISFVYGLIREIEKPKKPKREMSRSAILYTEYLNGMTAKESIELHPDWMPSHIRSVYYYCDHNLEKIKSILKKYE